MISLKLATTELKDVPVEWIFEYYLNLPVTLTGQDVQMKSVFNPNDTNPSFYVFFSRLTGKYRFKDFSTGAQGDAVTLVQMLFNLSTPGAAINKIIKDYVTQQSPMSRSMVASSDKFKVKAIKLRSWTEADRKYWSQYYITSDDLDFFHVKPLETFTASQEDGKNAFTVKNTNLYGYFKKDGTIYKIYQPLNKDHKFTHIKSYIQGAEQLTYEKPYLVICSSLKDLMSFRKLGFTDIECIAPDSESIMLSQKSVDKIKRNYKAACTLFDNDAAGLKSMEKYKDVYDLPYVHLKFEKDVADCVKTYGLINTRELLYPGLTKALTGKSKIIL